MKTIKGRIGKVGFNAWIHEHSYDRFDYRLKLSGMQTTEASSWFTFQAAETALRQFLDDIGAVIEEEG